MLEDGDVDKEGGNPSGAGQIMEGERPSRRIGGAGDLGVGVQELPNPFPLSPRGVNSQLGPPQAG